MEIRMSARLLPGIPVMRFAIGFLASALVGPLACGPSETGESEAEAAVEAALDELAELMTGSFSSQAQSRADSAFLDIRLEMVPIWPYHPEGRWLYVEQAEATSLGAPYRQRVYQLTAQDDSTFRSTIFSLPEPAISYAGVWRDDQPLEGLTPAQLELREGCDVILTTDGSGGFTGSTAERACVSTLRGAAYATTEVSLTAERLVSWDRGFNEAGEQVWGSPAGGYVFDRVMR
jgi:hypothetical protein